MLVVETIARIQRAYFGQRKLIKAICRDFRFSGEVVRKVARSGVTGSRYERELQPYLKIESRREQLDARLVANDG